MKHLFFVRHAKSSWADPYLSDHDRPLNSRGKRDAPLMAERLAATKVRADGVLVSSAKRAKKTAKVFREAFGLSKDQVIVQEELYHASPKTIQRAIRQLPDNWKTVLVFGHNPGFTELANLLKNDEYIGNVPTCGIVGAAADVKAWEDFQLSEAKRTSFLYPKQVK